MTGVATETRTVVVEREMPFPAERIWRALTQPHLIQEWLMKSDFAPAVGHRFNLSSPHVTIDCEVLEIEPQVRLAYSWDAYGLESTVTWTLTPTSGGTLLRMEQAGFRPDQREAYQGARLGWRRFFTKLEEVLAGVE